VRKLQPQLSIILLSGLAGALGLDEASTGADAVITKGANEIAYLLRAVTRLLALRVVRRPLCSQEDLEPKAKTRAASG